MMNDVVSQPKRPEGRNDTLLPFFIMLQGVQLRAGLPSDRSEEDSGKPAATFHDRSPSLLGLRDKPR
jgi:hypothetical protein